MFRAPDPWSDDQDDEEPLSCGFPDGLSEKYDLEKDIGKGGFGSVRIARSKATGNVALDIGPLFNGNQRQEMTRHSHGFLLVTGIEWACKAITKRLNIPNVSAARQQQHLDNIKREVLVSCWGRLVRDPHVYCSHSRGRPHPVLAAHTLHR
jgi:hypothetical protein